MSGDDLRVRLEVAIGDAMSDQKLIGSAAINRLQAGLVAGLEVVAAEVAAELEGIVRGHDAPAAVAEPPPVRALPTEPGAVVLVTEIRGTPLEGHPELAVSEYAADAGRITRWTVPNSPTSACLADEEITGWFPARVVRDDEQGPAAALRWIAEHQMPELPQYEQIGALRFKARAALDAIWGDPA